MQHRLETIESLIGTGDPPPFERVVRSRRLPVLVVCDHASNAIPGRLGTLGVAERHLTDHIAWDVGVDGVARELALALDASAIIAGYSRLVVDLNRALKDPSAIPALTDGVLVPGNLGLGPEERAQRIDAIYRPYHDAIDALIEDVSTDAVRPVVVAVHSFTPTVSGLARPWHVGVLYDKDPRVAIPLLRALRGFDGVVVGDNEPYSGRHAADFTIDHHAERTGLAHAAIELRHDLIRDEVGQRRWAEQLAEALAPILDHDLLYSRAATSAGSAA